MLHFLVSDLATLRVKMPQPDSLEISTAKWVRFWESHWEVVVGRTPLATQMGLDIFLAMLPLLK